MIVNVCCRVLAVSKSAASVYCRQLLGSQGYLVRWFHVLSIATWICDATCGLRGWRFTTAQIITLHMLRWRLVFGVLFIAALVLWCWLDANVTRPGAFLLPLALMLSWLGTEELLAMLNKRGRYPLPSVVYAGVLLTVLLSGLPVFWPGA